MNHESLRQNVIEALVKDTEVVAERLLRIAKRVRELAALPENWGGNNEARVSMQSLMHCHRIAVALITSTRYFAQMFPRPNGDVELEWTSGDCDFGVTVNPIKEEKPNASV